MVLLKNQGALPLRKDARLLVAGSRADDLGAQCGGWTVWWQGKRGRTTQGTTILEAITAAPDKDRAVVLRRSTSLARPPGAEPSKLVACVLALHVHLHLAIAKANN